MYNIVLLSVLIVAILSIGYALILIIGVNSKPSGSKKMADVSATLSDEMRSKKARNLKDFAMVAIMLFTGMMYAFGWKVATSFLVGAMLFALVDYYLMAFSLKTAPRLAEAAKTGVLAAYKLNYNFSSAYMLLSSGLGLLLLGGVYYLFKDATTLLALALSAVLASFFSWRSGRTSYFGSFIAATAAALVLANKNFTGNQTTAIFPLVFVALTILAAIISSVFSRLSSKTPNVSGAFYRGIIVVLIISLAGAYFGSKFLLLDAGKFGTIKLALAIGIGIILPIFAIIIRQISKILPTLVVAAAMLVANYLAGAYGVSLAIVGALSIWPLALIVNFFAYQAKSAGAVATSAEMPVGVTKNINIIEAVSLKTNGYFVSIFGFAALGLLIYFSLKFSGSNLLLSDPKLLSGLLSGGAVSYLLSSGLVSNKIFRVAVVVIGAILAGLTLGPTFLAGFITAAILIDLLVSQAVSSEVLLMTIVGVLITGMIENQFKVQIRAIIAGGAAALLSASLIIEKFYGKRTKTEG